MRKIYFLLIVIVFLTQAGSPLQAQTTEGREFWLTFGGWNIPNPLSNPYEMQIRIVCGSQPTTVTIHFTNLDTYFSTNISAHEVYTYSLDNTQKVAMYNMGTGKTNYSASITTTKPVSVYALQSLTVSRTDVTNLLPVTALNTEYYQMSYTVALPSFIDAYAIVATQNNTQLYHNGTPTEILNAGEVYYRTSNADMTSARITSNYPVTFFAAHQGAVIPNIGTTQSHLFQQISPVNTWGKTFFVPVSVLEREIVRIVVSQNNTNITQTGGAIRTGVPGAQTTLTNLQAGQFVELDITLTNNGCFIQADKPIGVCSYMANYDYTGFYSMPSQTWIPGVEQTASKVLTAPFIPDVPWSFEIKHYALVVTPTAKKNETTVSVGGDTPIGLFGDIWKDHDIAGMSFYSMPLTEATSSYTFYNPSGAIIWGYCTGLSLFASYYYLAGSAMHDLSAAFTANNIPYDELHSHPFCEHDITFVANIEGIHPNAGSLNWYINGVHQTALTDLHTWNQNFATGNYVIKMSVLFEDNSTEIFQDTLKIITCETAFYANNVHSDTLQNITFCEKTVNFQAEIEGQWVSIKWYLNGVEETTASNQETWSKEFTPGEHIGIPVKMEVLYANNETVTIESALNVRVFWTQIKNIRH